MTPIEKDSIPLSNFGNFPLVPQLDIDELRRIAEQDIQEESVQASPELQKELDLRDERYGKTYQPFKIAVRQLPYEAEQTMMRYKQRLSGLLAYTQELRVKVATAEDEHISGNLAHFTEYQSNSALLLGIQLYAFDLLRKMGNLSQQHSIYDEYQSWFPSALRMYCEVGLVNRAGVSIADCMFTKEPSVPISQQYQFLVEAFQEQENDESSNRYDPANEFPLLIGSYSRNLTRVAQAAGVSPGQLHPKGNLNSNPYKAAEYATRFLSQVDAVGKGMLPILTTPDHPEFEAAKAAFIALMSLRDTAHPFAFFRTGLIRYSVIVDTYRTMRTFEQNGVESDFYSFFCDKLLLFAEKYGVLEMYVTADDIEDIYDRESGTDAEMLQPFSAKDLIQRTEKVSKKNSFSIDVTRINWRGFIPPTRAELQFYQNTIVGMSLTYENSETGESVLFSFDNSLRTLALDWNLIESPDDPAFESLRVSAQTVLIDAIHTISPQTQKVVAATLVEKVEKKPKRERNADPIYEIRKATQATGKQMVPPREFFTQQGETKQYKPVAAITKKAAKIFSTFDSEVQSKFLDAFARFGERQQQHVGQMKKIGSTFRLRSGDYRAILVEEKEGYTITDVGNRKDIYKRQ